MNSATAINLQEWKEAQKPHLVLACSDAVHVVPLAYFEALIAGEDVEPLPAPMLAKILQEWLLGIALWNEL